MKTWEAMKLLEEGKKVRRKCWKRLDYIMLHPKGVIVDNHGRVCPISLSRLWDDWEEVA